MPLPESPNVASVEEHPSRFIGRSPESLVAEFEERMVTSTENATGEDGSPVTTTHTRAGTTVMYKPTERQGYVPRTVSGSAMRQLIRQGWKEFCPDCKGHHLDKNGQHSTDPNLCKARAPLAVRVCRVCAKRIYDNQRLQEAEIDNSDDPNVIEDDMYDNSTPAKRTEMALNAHYWARHTIWAQTNGVPPLPEALRDLIPATEQKAG